MRRKPDGLLARPRTAGCTCCRSAALPATLRGLEHTSQCALDRLLLANVHRVHRHDAAEALGEAGRGTAYPAALAAAEDGRLAPPGNAAKLLARHEQQQKRTTARGAGERTEAGRELPTRTSSAFDQSRHRALMAHSKSPGHTRLHGTPLERYTQPKVRPTLYERRWLMQVPMGKSRHLITDADVLVSLAKESYRRQQQRVRQELRQQLGLDEKALPAEKQWQPVPQPSLQPRQGQGQHLQPHDHEADVVSYQPPRAAQAPLHGDTPITTTSDQ